MNWKCSKCEDVRDRQFRRACSFGGQCEYRETLPVHRLAWHWLTCPHRGDAIAKISGTTAGTGCGCENVEVYRCDHFGQPVIKRASPRCLEKIAASVPGYTGRTCRECKLPTKETETKEQKNQPETRQETSFDIEKHLAEVPYHPLVRSIAAVTCHFNPQRSQSRIRCYETFARQFPRIGMELFTAEGSLDDQWEIPGAWRYDLDPEACLFAKENLLNLAIARLPDRFERVVWIDSDVIILDNDYAGKLSDSLGKHTAVQAFQELRYQGPNGGWETGWRSSIGYINAKHGTAVAEPKEGYPGLVWAMHRDVLTAGGGIYDRVITGGGDVAWCVGMWGDLKPRYASHWSVALTADIHRWAAGMKPHVRSVGYVASRGVHLYHGRLKSRQYVRRNEILGEVGYDPQRDLEYAPNGTLRWSAAAPQALRDAVREYILGRKEDAK